MSEHDPIEALLKSSGRRPAVDAGRDERVRRTVHARWQDEIARRSRRNRIRFAVTLAAAAVFVIAIGLSIRSRVASVAQGPSEVRVERVTEVVWERVGSVPMFRSERTLSPGSFVALGAEVSTSAGSRVALRVPTGHSLRLDTDTSLRVVSDRAFALARGAVYVDGPGDGASIRIDTPFGAVEDRGTQFQARVAGGSLSVAVREGAVTVTAASGPAVARAGQALTVDRSGRVEIVDEPGGAEAWSWVESVVPMMEIDGRSLRHFLDWAVRERGAGLRFEGAGLPEKASSIVLRGSVSGMTLEEATTSVLQTSGLAGRWEDGVLVVTAEPGPPPY